MNTASEITRYMTIVGVACALFEQCMTKNGKIYLQVNFGILLMIHTFEVCIQI